MTPPWVLDTSALMAHFFTEPGWEVIERLLETEPNQVFINAIVWIEFQIRLKVVVPDFAERQRTLKIYADLLAQALPVTREEAQAALELREASPTRLPNADALIAATAKLRSATLIHRDAHLAAIPPELLRQYQLPDPTPSAAGG